MDCYIRSHDAKSVFKDLYIHPLQCLVSSRLSTRGSAGNSQPNSRPGTGASGLGGRNTPSPTTEKTSEVKSKLRAGAQPLLLFLVWLLLLLLHRLLLAAAAAAAAALLLPTGGVPWSRAQQTALA